MIGNAETWRRLTEADSAELCAAAAGGATLSVARVAALRKRFPAELVAAAAELGEARKRAAAKFGEQRAASLLADRAGVEMASSMAVAAHKAARLVQVAGRGARVADLCCGIGGDAMAMQAAGLDVVGVDADPVRAWMCGLNARCPTLHARVEDASWRAAWFHLDPARRTAEGRRTFRLEDLVPGPDVWRTVIDLARAAAPGEPFGGAIKLGPGADDAEVRAALGAGVPVEVEYISENGRMAQAVAWVGAAATGASVRATMLRDGRDWSIAGDRGEAMEGAMGTYLLEADDAAERAGLLGLLAGRIGARSLCPGIGLLTADHAANDAWFSSFQILARMPWSEKRVRAWLREHDGGPVEVKTRARAVEPDGLQVRLRAAGSTAFTIFVLRIGRELEAFITTRAACPAV